MNLFFAKLLNSFDDLLGSNKSILYLFFVQLCLFLYFLIGWELKTALKGHP